MSISKFKKKKHDDIGFTLISIKVNNSVRNINIFRTCGDTFKVQRPSFADQQSSGFLSISVKDADNAVCKKNGYFSGYKTSSCGFGKIEKWVVVKDVDKITLEN